MLLFACPSGILWVGWVVLLGVTCGQNKTCSGYSRSNKFTKSLNSPELKKFNGIQLQCTYKQQSNYFFYLIHTTKIHRTHNTHTEHRHTNCKQNNCMWVVKSQLAWVSTQYMTSSDTQEFPKIRWRLQKNHNIRLGLQTQNTQIQKRAKVHESWFSG